MKNWWRKFRSTAAVQLPLLRAKIMTVLTNFNQRRKYSMNANLRATIGAAIPIIAGYVIAAQLGLPGWAGVVYMAVVLGLLLVLLYFSADADMQATFLETGEIKFVVWGESVERVLENIEGWHYHEATGEIIEDDPAVGYHRAKSLLEGWLGIYWVSILYPIKKIHLYQFEWPKLLMGGHPQDASKGKIVPVGGDSDYSIEHRDEPIDSLYFRYAYPVFSETVELADNFTVDILVNITFQVVFPKTPVFVFKGKWLAPATAAVRGAIADFSNNWNLEKFRDLDKQLPDNEFSRAIMKINGDPAAAGGYGPGIIKSFGVMVHKVDFIKYDLSEKHQQVIDASTAEKVAELNANAARKTAGGVADAIRSVQGAEAEMLTARLAAASTHALGGEVLIEQLRKEGLIGFRGSVLSLGESRTGVMVNAGEKPKSDVASTL